MIEAKEVGLLKSSDKIKMDRLYDACFSANWAVVDQLLNERVSVQYAHPKNGMTTLYVAVARNAPLETIRRLVEQGGAHPNQGDWKGFSPLHAACEYHVPLHVVEYLLSVGADPNQAAEDGATPLHFACQYLVRIPVLRALIRAGADVNAKKENGATPLFSAVENGASAAFIRVLLDAGADCNLKLFNPRTNEHDTLLSVAKRKCSADVLGLLEQRESNHQSGQNSVLDTGNFSDKVEKARLLLRHAFTANSTLSVAENYVPKEDQGEECISVREGEKVTLVHGSLEDGLFSPYEEYVLVSTSDGKIGKVPRRILYDGANLPLNLEEERNGKPEQNS